MRLFPNGGKGDIRPFAQVVRFKPLPVAQVECEGMQRAIRFPLDPPEITDRQTFQAVFIRKAAHAEQLVSDDEVFRPAVDFQQILPSEEGGTGGRTWLDAHAHHFESSGDRAR